MERCGHSARGLLLTSTCSGRYRFRVIANSDGIWSNDGASVSFDIPPTFFQTGWFAALCIASGIALLYLLYLARVRQVAARVRDRLVAKNVRNESVGLRAHFMTPYCRVLKDSFCAFRPPPINYRLTICSRGIGLALQRADEVMPEGRDRVQDLRISDQLSRNLAESLASVGEDLAREYQLELVIRN